MDGRHDSFSIIRSQDTFEELDAEYSPMKGPVFRPDLCREEQIAAVNEHKWKMQQQYINDQNALLEVTFNHQQAALNILLSEAHRLHQVSTRVAKQRSSRENYVIRAPSDDDVCQGSDDTVSSTDSVQNCVSYECNTAEEGTLTPCNVSRVDDGGSLTSDRPMSPEPKLATSATLSDNGEDPELWDADLMVKWKQLGAYAMRDLEYVGHQQVVRNLSCMCMFVEGRDSPVYGDHEGDRARRVTAQCDLLSKLHEKRTQGDPNLFL